VTAANISGSGASFGQVLKYNGSAVVWSTDLSGGLTLPYEGKSTDANPSFFVTNTGFGYAIKGQASNNSAIYGYTASSNANHAAVWGENAGNGPGVAGTAPQGSIGVFGSSTGTGSGVKGVGLMAASGVRGEAAQGAGVVAVSTSGDGVATSTSGASKSAVYAAANGSYGYGGYFVSASGDGVFATTNGALKSGVYAVSNGANGYGGYFVGKNVTGTGIYATSPSGVAARFQGTVNVSGGRVVTPVLEITGGSDLSEQFNVRQTDNDRAPTPGMVVSIDPDRSGGLVISHTAYDRRIAGIISGAGGVSPGMLMGQQGSAADGDNPVALTGRVYCWADTTNGAIEPGDLLTTADVPGHAMKVTDFAKAQGAILGKAMSSLKSGKGLVLVLVNLQ
jgi:hypothetical protein